jgi:hypothetical protein
MDDKDRKAFDRMLLESEDESQGRVQRGILANMPPPRVKK